MKKLRAGLMAIALMGTMALAARPASPDVGLFLAFKTNGRSVGATIGAGGALTGFAMFYKPAIFNNFYVFAASLVGVAL